MRIDNDLDRLDWGLVAVLIVGMIVCAFLCGQDDALDEINYAERLRVMCATPGHSETLCHNTAQGRNHAN